MATPNQEKKTRKKVAAKRVKIIRVNPDNIRPIFANDFIVSHTEREFFFTFSVLEPLEIQGPSELEKIDMIEAIARAKIAITPEFTEAILKALSINIDNYKRSRKEDAQKDN